MENILVFLMPMIISAVISIIALLIIRFLFKKNWNVAVGIAIIIYGTCMIVWTRLIEPRL